MSEREPKKGRITFVGANPLALIEDPEAELHLTTPTPQQQTLVDAIGNSIAAYVKAAKALLAGRLAHLRSLAPPHLADPGNVLVACCQDGVVIRYEVKSSDAPRVIRGWMSGTLTEVAATVSQNLVVCHLDKNYTPTPPVGGTEISMATVKADTGERTIFATAQIWFDTVVEKPDTPPPPPAKPFSLLSVRNTIEVQLVGELRSAGPSQRPPQPFLARSAMRLPVGWECIEIFPFAADESWKPEYAHLWAENDILAAVLAHQFLEAEFNSLDPKVEARRGAAQLLDRYKQLLDSGPDREEILQVFLAENPVLLCPAHTHMWPKLALGSHVTDFVFQEAVGDYLLVELEKPTDRMFRRDGHETSNLTHARGQIHDWKRYLEDNLATVQRELGLHGISPSPRCLVVMDRSANLSPANRRVLAATENESPRVKVMTYDDVLENAKAVVENLLGPLWNVQGNTRVYYLPATPPPMAPPN